MSLSLSQLTDFAQTLNWTNPTWDLFILVFFAVATVLYGASLGRDRIIVIMVGLYMALAVVTNVPFVKAFNATLTVNKNFIVHFTAFIGLFVVLFFLLSRSALLRAFGTGGHAVSSWWQVMLFSFLQVGLLISIVLSFLPMTALQNFSPLTRLIFQSDTGRFVWIVAPIAAMVLFGGRRRAERFEE